MRPHLRRMLTLMCILPPCALLALLLFLPLPAAAGDTPLVLGSIEGVVRNGQGDPLPNINVRVYDAQGAPIVGPVATDGAGTYRVPALPPGSYYLEFSDPAGDYAQLYYPAGGMREEGTPVVVNGDSVTGRDVVLMPAADIDIRIQSIYTLAVTGVQVKLYRQHRLGPWLPFAERILYTPDRPSILPTAASFAGLAAGSYRVCVEGSGVVGMAYPVAECYDDVLPSRGTFPVDRATPITLTSGASKQITITFGDIAQIQGTILSAQGQPIAHAAVHLEARPLQYMFYLETDAQGRFRLDNLPSYYNGGSEFVLWAFEPRGDSLAAYYPGVFSPDQAAILNLVPENRIHLTLTLPASAKITGRVQSEGGGIPSNAYFTVESRDGANGWTSPVCYGTGTCAETRYDADTGQYTVTRLVGGTYRVGVGTLFGAAYVGGNTPEEADPLVVAAGKTLSGADITVGANAFAGAITGQVRAQGAPQPGIEVGLFWTALGGEFLPRVVVTTDAQGRYWFGGLPAGRYQIAFRDPGRRFALQYYFPPCSDPCGNWVDVRSHEVVTTVGVDLRLGTTIRGQVRGEDGKPAPLAKVNVAEVLQNDPAAGYYAYEWLSFMEFTTDAHGYYTTTALAPGSYFVRATIPPQYDRERWYTVEPKIQRPTAVTLITGTHAVDVDVSYAPASGLYLPLVPDPAK